MKDDDSFWVRQPVGIGAESNPISMPTKISTQPYKLPPGFSFVAVSDTKELSRFLHENYVEDLDEEFRLLYSDKFLSWILRNPNHKEEYSLGLRFNNTLVGYVFGKETNLVVNGMKNKTAGVNFLCVAKDFRNKRVAPVLIQELVRRFNCNGIFQGVFTAGTDLFFNVMTSKYFHKPLNIKKLVSCNFANQETEVKLQKPRDGTRKIRDSDIEKIYDMYTRYIRQFKMAEFMDIQEFKWIVSSTEVCTYVYETDGDIVSFGVYYALETLAINKGCRIKGAYLGYVCGDITDMINDLIYFAHLDKCDVFNCLNIGENRQVIEKLGFIEGTGELKYYLYNWRCPLLNPEDVYLYML